MKHGLTGYVRDKCRCDICKTAKRASATKSYDKHRDARRAQMNAYAREHRAESNERVKKWVAANPGRARASARERTKRWADANRETVRAKYRIWLANNPEKAQAAHRAYVVANPEKVRAHGKIRRVRLLGADVRTVTERDWRRLCARYDNRCAYCGASEELQKDHIIPITKGGRHSIGNLLPACKPCNSSKNDTLLVKWRGRRIDPATSALGRSDGNVPDIR